MNKERLTRIALAVLKHISTNDRLYLTMIGALTQDDYTMVLTYLKLLLLRTVIGGAQRRIKRWKKKDVKNTKP